MQCTIQEALPQITAELTEDAAAGKSSGLLDIFVTDLVPHREEELIEEVMRPLLSATPRIIRKGALVVLTFKARAMRGNSEAGVQKIAEDQARKLDGLLEVGRTTVVHLMANRLRERTLVGYAA